MTDITQMSIIELKALAFDELGKREQIDNNLRLINQELSIRYAEEQKKKTE